MTKEHTVCSLGLPTIIRETATECTIRRLAEHEKTCDVIWLKRMFYQRLPNQRELTTKSITYDVIQEQNQDQDQDQDHDQTNNQAVGTQNNDEMQIVDDSTSIEDGEGQNGTEDQTEQSNDDEQESTQDDAEGSPHQPNETTTTSSGHAVQ